MYIIFTKYFHPSMDTPYARNKNNRTETIIIFAGYILYIIYSGFKGSTFTFRNMHSNNYYLLFKKDYPCKPMLTT